LLCDQVLETADHLVLNCPYAKEVWQGQASTHQAAANIGSRSATINGWWKKMSRFRKSKMRRQQAAAAGYVAWHLWKERSRRIFEDVSCDPDSLLHLIRADLSSLY
jgi:hypothetical protein